jgi:hypothetical protein
MGSDSRISNQELTTEDLSFPITAFHTPHRDNSYGLFAEHLIHSLNPLFFTNSWCYFEDERNNSQCFCWIIRAILFVKKKKTVYLLFIPIKGHMYQVLTDVKGRRNWQTSPHTGQDRPAYSGSWAPATCHALAVRLRTWWVRKGNAHMCVEIFKKTASSS